MDKTISSAELDVILELIRSMKADFFMQFKKTNNPKFEELYNKVNTIESSIYLGNEKGINSFLEFYQDYKLNGGDFDA